MKIILISAVSLDGVIGIDNEMPWRIPEDFKHFRNTTMGHTLIVGSNTFKTLPPKAHEGRNFIILTNHINPDLDTNKYIQVSGIDNVIKYLSDNDLGDVYVIGGENVYEQFYDYADEAIITWVNKLYPNGNKKFSVGTLFNDFFETTTTDWMKSKTGLSYKITNYVKRQENT